MNKLGTNHRYGKKAQPLNFENTLIELENVVNRLEQGDLPLDDALSQFEQGVNLAKQAQEKLANAEQQYRSCWKKIAPRH